MLWGKGCGGKQGDENNTILAFKELFSLDLWFLGKYKNKNHESDSRPILSPIGVDGGRGRKSFYFLKILSLTSLFLGPFRGCRQKEPWLVCSRGEDDDDQMVVCRPH